MTLQRPNRILSALELKLSPVMTAILLTGLMWLLARNTPGFSIDPAVRIGVCAALVALGTAVGLAGVWSFRKARTTVNPWRVHGSTELVVSGIYRHTRNPMYVGLLLALLGWGVYLANAFALLLALAFVPFMNHFQIRPEERALQHAWGEDFLRYCRRVRRWF
jgi:protein-S-isoprenylcysteine O-methyltransferase Ste14